MNARELERRFLGNFVHTLAMDEQVDWLEAQPEVEDALNALSNGEDWMTTRFVDALDAVHCARVQRLAEVNERERIADTFTIATVLNEVVLPTGVVVKLLPKDMRFDARLDRPVTVEFCVGESVLARYTLDPRIGEGRLRAGYKKFVREQLAARLANRTRSMQKFKNEDSHKTALGRVTA